jgi:hypothetical protein
MTKSLSIEEVELLSFFEVEPTACEPELPWVYNDSVYEVRDARCQLSFAIAPAAKDVRVLLNLDGVLLYELNAVAIEDVRLHKDKGRESLEIIVSRGDSVWLRTKPNISIRHQVADEP